MEKRKTFLLISASIVGLLLGAVLLALWTPPQPLPPAFPSPNGYDAFVQAGKLVQNQSSDYAKMSAEELRNLVDDNSNAVQTVRSGLAQQSRVPVASSEQSITNHVGDLQRIKTLAFALLAEGRLAELEQRTNDAARAYLDAARLGIKARRGGNLLDALVGIAVESMGTSQLQKKVPNLEANISADLARQLETVDAEKETWDEIMQNEKYWSRRQSNSLQRRIAEVIAAAESKAAREKSKKRFETQQAASHRLMLDLATHAYELDKGHRPTNVTVLVPDYLKAAPIDPQTGKAMSLLP